MDARMGVLWGRAVCLPLFLRISSRRQALAYCTIFYGMQAGRFTLKQRENHEKQTIELSTMDCVLRRGLLSLDQRLDIARARRIHVPALGIVGVRWAQP